MQNKPKNKTNVKTKKDEKQGNNEHKQMSKKDFTVM